MVAIPFLFKWTKDSRFDAAFGELSYPIYIVQFVVIDFLVKILKDTPSYEYLPVWVVGGCAVLAILINKLVSDPVEKIRKARAVR
jgi:peptidoglycan/LPS O-acetylase OafA/YrhL